MTQQKLLAFNGDQQLRDDMVAEVKWHQEQDKIIQGTYGDNGKYCAVGCAINSLNRKRGKDYPTNRHQVYEDELGIPATIAHLEERIFEGLPAKQAQKFPLRFMEAVKCGADLTLVTPKFMVWLLTDKKHGVIQYADAQGRAAVQQVADLYNRVIAGESVTDEEWDKAAEAAAWAAAEAARAAWAARDAAEAVRAAARAAAWAARAAARAARAAAGAAWAAEAAEAAGAAWAAEAAEAAWAARAAEYEAMADKLIELLKAAPVGRD